MCKRGINLQTKPLHSPDFAHFRDLLRAQGNDDWLSDMAGPIFELRPQAHEAGVITAHHLPMAALFPFYEFA